MGVNLWDKRQEMEDEQFTPVVSTLVPGIPFYAQLGVVEERMHILMGQLEGVNLWDKRQKMDDEQFTPVVSTLVPGIPFHEQLGWWRKGCALSWDDWTGSTSGKRGRRWRMNSSHLW